MTGEGGFPLPGRGANNEVPTSVVLQKALERLVRVHPADEGSGVLLDDFGLYCKIVSGRGSRGIVGRSAIGLGDEVGKRSSHELGKLVGAGERAAGVLAFQVGFEFFELLNRFDNLRRFLGGLGSKAVLLLDLVPWRLGIKQENKNALAGALGGIDFQPGDGALAVATQFRWGDKAVAVGNDADDRSSGDGDL